MKTASLGEIHKDLVIVKVWLFEKKDKKREGKEKENLLGESQAFFSKSVVRGSGC